MDVAAARDLAATEAAALVEAGMVVGLGSGDTAERAIRALAARGLAVTAVASSTRSELLARSLGMTVAAPDEVAALDLTIDGADEFDAHLCLVKGHGGALTREKLLARASRRLVIVVDAGKRVARLGEKMRLAVEIVPFGTAWTRARIDALGFDPRLRLRDDGHPFVTDNGGLILDCALPAARTPEWIARALDGVTGVVEHGLFLDEAERILVGHADRVETLLRARPT